MKAPNLVHRRTLRVGLDTNLLVKQLASVVQTGSGVALPLHARKYIVLLQVRQQMEQSSVLTTLMQKNASSNAMRGTREKAQHAESARMMVSGQVQKPTAKSRTVVVWRVQNMVVPHVRLPHLESSVNSTATSATHSRAPKPAHVVQMALGQAVQQSVW